MATFGLIHGAGDVGWYWHLVAAELRGRGHDAVAPDLPCEDDAAGLAEYADTVAGALADRRDVVVVAQSFGAFTAPLVCERRAVDLLVLLAGMVPSPGERPEDWPERTGWTQAQRDTGERATDDVALGWSGSGWASSPTSSTAATASRSAAPPSWRGGWRSTSPSRSSGGEGYDSRSSERTASTTWFACTGFTR